jgi:hypothetical protein
VNTCTAGAAAVSRWSTTGDPPPPRPGRWASPRRRPRPTARWRGNRDHMPPGALDGGGGWSAAPPFAALAASATRSDASPPATSSSSVPPRSAAGCAWQHVHVDVARTRRRCLGATRRTRRTQRHHDADEQYVIFWCFVQFTYCWSDCNGNVWYLILILNLN